MSSPFRIKDPISPSEFFMENYIQDGKAVRFQKLILIEVVVVFAIGIWLTRTTLLGLSIVIGLAVSLPMLMFLSIRYYRNHNLVVIGVGNNISDRNLSVVLLLSAVLLLAETALAYYELDLVIFLLTITAFAAALLIIMAFAAKYNRKHFSQSA